MRCSVAGWTVGKCHVERADIALIAAPVYRARLPFGAALIAESSIPIFAAMASTADCTNSILVSRVANRACTSPYHHVAAPETVTTIARVEDDLGDVRRRGVVVADLLREAGDAQRQRGRGGDARQARRAHACGVGRRYALDRRVVPDAGLIDDEPEARPDLEEEIRIVDDVGGDSGAGGERGRAPGIEPVDDEAGAERDDGIALGDDMRVVEGELNGGQRSGPGGAVTTAHRTKPESARGIRHGICSMDGGRSRARRDRGVESWPAEEFR